VAALLVTAASGAQATEAPALLPADATIVAAERPLAIQGALPRLGSGWRDAVRRVTGLPQAVDPFDPALFSTLGIDPAATVWQAVRPLRGAIHVRGVIALTEARLADALVSSLGALASVKLTRSPAGAWLAGLPRGDAAVARLDGNLLVVDALLGNKKPVTPTELARLVPLRPPRVLQLHGAARRLGPAAAAGLWLDLDGLGTLALVRAEIEVAAAVTVAAPAVRAQLTQAARKEIATCRAALRRPGATFDDAFVGVALHGPEALELEVALGGARVALDALRGAPVQASRTLSPADLESELRLTLIDAGPLRAALRPAQADPRTLAPHECPAAARLAIALRRWPALLGGELAAQRASQSAAFLRLLTGLRGVTAYLPGAAAPAAAGDKRSDEQALNLREVLLLAELDDAVRGDLDRMLAGTFAAANPLRAGGRQLTTYAIPPSFFFAQADGPVVTVDPLPGATTGAIVGFGAREKLRAALERVAATPPTTQSAPGTIARMTAGPRLVSRVVRDAAGRAAERSLSDGVAGIEGTLVLEPELLRVDVDVALRPPAPR
jgi:hypothetical protein